MERKVHFRSLESLSEPRKFDCIFKFNGCPAKLSRGEMYFHSDNCEFSGNNVSFCKYLGYTCDFRFNIRHVKQGLDHLAKDHGFKFRRHAYNAVIFLSWSLDFDLEAKGPANTPVVVRLENGQGFLIFVNLYNEQQETLTVTCFYLASENMRSRISVQFALKSANSSKNPDVLWTRKPWSIKHVERAIRSQDFHFPMDLLRNNFSVDGSIRVHCSLTNKVERYRSEGNSVMLINSAPSLPLVPFVSKFQPYSEITPTSDQARPYNRLQVKAPEKERVRLCQFECVICNVQGLTCVAKCLECPSICFCFGCYSKDVHSQHLVTMITCKQQAEEICRKLRTPFGWHAMFPSRLGLRAVSVYFKLGPLPKWSSRNAICSTPHCGRITNWICLYCRPVIGSCKRCENKFHHQHKEHLKVYLSTKDKLEKLLRILPECY